MITRRLFPALFGSLFAGAVAAYAGAFSPTFAPERSGHADGHARGHHAEQRAGRGDTTRRDQRAADAAAAAVRGRPDTSTVVAVIAAAAGSERDGDSAVTTRGGMGHGAGPAVAGTYLVDAAAAEGSARLKRWSDRTAAPIRVWVAPGDTVPGWRAPFTEAVHDAFAAWVESGLPLRYVFVAAPEDADIRVTWADRLDRQRAGVTHWTADRGGWLTRVHVELAMWASDGTPADEASMRRIALHEVGHALGLEHSADPGDVMAAWVHAGRLSERDRATARLLYTLAPGAAADAAR